MSLTSNFDVFALIMEQIDYRTMLSLRLVCSDWKNVIDYYLCTLQTIKIVTCKDDLVDLTKSVSEISNSMMLNPAEMLFRWNIIYAKPSFLKTKEFAKHITEKFPNLRRLFFYTSGKTQKETCLDYSKILQGWPKLSTLVVSHIDQASASQFLQSLNKCQWLRKLVIFDEDKAVSFFKPTDRIVHQLEYLFLPSTQWVQDFTPKYLKAFGVKKIVHSFSNLDFFLNLKTISLPSDHDINRRSFITELSSTELIEQFSQEDLKISSLEIKTIFYGNMSSLGPLFHMIDRLESLVVLKLSFIRQPDIKFALEALSELRFAEIVYINLMPVALKCDLSKLNLDYFPAKMKSIQTIVFQPMFDNGLKVFKQNKFHLLNYQVLIRPLVNLSSIKNYPLPQTPGSRVRAL